MMVVMLIAQSLSGIPFLNKQLDNYNKYLSEYNSLLNSYSGFKLELADKFEDNELSVKEYESLIEDYSEYQEVLDKYYGDEKLSKSEYKKINTKIDEEYQDSYKEVYYKLEKNSLVYYGIYLITVFAYFVGFNKLTNGQTLGKKLTRLKIINNADIEKEVPIWSYVVRALILYEPICYLVKLGTINFLSMSDYHTVTAIVGDLQYYLEMLLIVMVMIRIDGRGPQDLLAKTRVIVVDRDGDEVVSEYEKLVSQKLAVNKKKGKKKIIEEEEPSE